MKWIFVAGLPVFALLSGCVMNSAPPEAIAPGVPWAVTHPPESVDPAVYLDLDDPTDPYASVYADFRARRLRDRAAPGASAISSAASNGGATLGRPRTGPAVRLAGGGCRAASGSGGAP